MQESRWDDFRRQMPVTRRWAYMDHAAVAPLPQAALAAVQQWAHEAASEGDTAWPRWSRGVEQTRQQAASLLHAEPREIALVPNTTVGINLVAEGFPWRDGDNIVVIDNEFPSNLFPWMNLASLGVEARMVSTDQGRIDLDRIADACDRRTRLVAASWVGYASGWRIDVDQLAQVVHDRGALLMLDAIQGVGVYPLDLRRSGVDFAAADGHKWMLGPEGAGIFFCRHEHLGLLRPLGVGWHSVNTSHDFQNHQMDLKDAAARYEGGTHNTVGFLGLSASLGLLMDLGLTADSSPIAERVMQLGDHAAERLQSVGARLIFHRDAAHRTSIVTFALRDLPADQIRRACLSAGVVVSCRGGGVRLSLHAYNTEDEVERLVGVLSKF